MVAGGMVFFKMNLVLFLLLLPMCFKNSKNYHVIIISQSSLSMRKFVRNLAIGVLVRLVIGVNPLEEHGSSKLKIGSLKTQEYSSHGN